MSHSLFINCSEGFCLIASPYGSILDQADFSTECSYLLAGLSAGTAGISHKIVLLLEFRKKKILFTSGHN